MKTFAIINGMDFKTIQKKDIKEAITYAQNYCDHSKEVLVREIQPKTTYYLLGEDAVRELQENGVEGIIFQSETNELSYTLFEFTETITPSHELAEAMNGCHDYAIITKEEFDQL